jgi:hypothetical protein
VLEDLLCDAGTAIYDVDFHGSDVETSRLHHEIAAGRVDHCFDGVANEIDEHLLDLNAIGEYLCGIAVESEARCDVL